MTSTITVTPFFDTGRWVVGVLGRKGQPIRTEWVHDTKADAVDSAHACAWEWGLEPGSYRVIADG